MIYIYLCFMINISCHSRETLHSLRTIEGRLNKEVNCLKCSWKVLYRTINYYGKIKSFHIFIECKKFLICIMRIHFLLCVYIIFIFLSNLSLHGLSVLSRTWRTTKGLMHMLFELKIASKPIKSIGNDARMFMS